MTSLLTAEEQQVAQEAPEFALAPEGIYICRVFEVDRWVTGSLVWKFRVAKGQKYAGKQFWTWTGLKAEGIGRTKAYLTALGFGLNAEPDDIVGTPCKIQVAIEARSDTGEPANKVKRVFPYDGPELPDEYGNSDIDDAFGAEPSDDEKLI